MFNNKKKKQQIIINTIDAISHSFKIIITVLLHDSSWYGLSQWILQNLFYIFKKRRISMTDQTACLFKTVSYLTFTSIKHTGDG